MGRGRVGKFFSFLFLISSHCPIFAHNSLSCTIQHLSPSIQSKDISDQPSSPSLSSINPDERIVKWCSIKARSPQILDFVVQISLLLLNFYCCPFCILDIPVRSASSRIEQPCLVDYRTKERHVIRHFQSGVCSTL